MGLLAWDCYPLWDYVPITSNNIQFFCWQISWETPVGFLFAKTVSGRDGTSWDIMEYHRIFNTKQLSYLNLKMECTNKNHSQFMAISIGKTGSATGFWVPHCQTNICGQATSIHHNSSVFIIFSPYDILSLHFKNPKCPQVQVFRMGIFRPRRMGGSMGWTPLIRWVNGAPKTMVSSRLCKFHFRTV